MKIFRSWLRNMWDTNGVSRYQKMEQTYNGISMDALDDVAQAAVDHMQPQVTEALTRARHAVQLASNAAVRADQACLRVAPVVYTIPDSVSMLADYDKVCRAVNADLDAVKKGLVRLTLTKDEALSLLAVCRRVGGSDTDSRRVHIDKVHDQLLGQGITYDTAEYNNLGLDGGLRFMKGI